MALSFVVLFVLSSTPCLELPKPEKRHQSARRQTAQALRRQGKSYLSEVQKCESEKWNGKARTAEPLCGLGLKVHLVEACATPDGGDVDAAQSPNVPEGDKSRLLLTTGTLLQSQLCPNTPLTDGGLQAIALYRAACELEGVP